MFGADEFTIQDRNWNVAFVSRTKAGADKYLNDVKALGFEVEGGRVLATKRELEAAFFSPSGGALRERGCDHNWKPIALEGPRMRCVSCGKEEY